MEYYDKDAIKEALMGLWIWLFLLFVIFFSAYLYVL